MFSLAKSDLHNGFDQDDWLLLPSEEIVKKLSASLIMIGGEPLSNREAFPSDAELGVCLFL